MKETSKPNVLIIGGCGFIGRNLVQYLVESDVCNHIKVIDKTTPTVAFLSKQHADLFKHPKVKFKQGNAKSIESLKRCWASKHGVFDYVFNLAAETKYGQNPIVYEENTVEVVKTIIEVAKDRPKVKRYFDISTAQVYSSDKKPSNESGKIKPWTCLAEHKLTTETLWKESKLPVIILRASIVYGPGDILGLMPRVTIARVYQYVRKTMKFLWSGDLKINTVHVMDVCRALWHLTKHGKDGAIYNLSDKSDTDQKKSNQILESIFNIRTGFTSSIASKVAKLSLQSVTKAVNNKHMKPWFSLTSQNGVIASPISPNLYPELLSDNHLSIDGSFIESTGFQYIHPHITKELVQEQLDYWIAMNVFPKLEGVDNSEPVDDDESDSDYEIDEE